MELEPALLRKRADGRLRTELLFNSVGSGLIVVGLQLTRSDRGWTLRSARSIAGFDVRIVQLVDSLDSSLFGISRDAAVTSVWAVWTALFGMSRGKAVNSV